MDSLRNLTVGITFEDNATRDLIRIDEKTDDIRDNFRGMSANLAGLSAGFTQVGISGSRAMDGIEDATEDATKDLITMGITGEIALNRIEDKADEAGNGIDDLGGKIKGTTARIASMGATIGLISVGFSGAVAAAAPLIAGIGGLAASFGAAGAGAVAFGAVATSSLHNVFDAEKEVEKLQEKIANAGSLKERIKAQKELAALYKNMSKAQREALNELQGFKAFWGGFVKEFETPVFNSFSQGLGIAKNLLNSLKPTISSFGNVVNKMLGKVNSAFASGELKGFFDWLGKTAGPSLEAGMTAAGNVMKGFMNLFVAFDPLISSVNNGLVNLTQRFEKWSAGLSQSKGFQNFIEYAKENGPVLMDTLSNIWDIGVKLVKAFAPLGSEVLKGFQSLTDYVSTNVVPIISDAADKAAGFASTIRDNWGPIKETVIGLGTAVGSFKIIMGGLQVVGIVTKLMQAFRTATLEATLAEWGLNASLWANPATWVVAGIAALIGIGVLLYRNWDTIEAKAGKLWASMREKWAGIKQSTSEAWGNVKTKIAEAMETAKTKVSNFFSPLLEFIRSAKQKWDSFVGALKNFKMPKIGLPKWMGGKGLIQVPGHATGLARVPYDNYLMRAHKDEAVLTAEQSNALRDAGILKSTADGKPVLDFKSISAPVAANTATNTNNTPPINIYVSGAEQPEIVARLIRKELESFFYQMQLKQA